MRVRFSLLFLALVTAGGCGGTGSGAAPSPPVISPAPSPSPTMQARPASATFSFTLPSRQKSARSRPEYLPAAVDEVAIAVKSVNGAAPTSPSVNFISVKTCTPVGPPGPGQTLSCSATFSEPAGEVTFAIVSYHDAGADLIPYSYAEPRVILVPGVPQSVSVTLSLIVAQASLALGTPAKPGAISGYPIVLGLNDASNNTAAYPQAFATPIQVSLSDRTGVTGLQVGMNAPVDAVSFPSTVYIPQLTNTGQQSVTFTMSVDTSAFSVPAYFGTLTAPFRAIPATTTSLSVTCTPLGCGVGSGTPIFTIN